MSVSVYDKSKYTFDRRHLRANATLDEGAFLYRLTSENWTGRECILTGHGPLNTRSSGRFHVTQQTATYCANNIFIALSEILYHNYRNVLNKMVAMHDADVILPFLEQERYLVIFRVKTIADLVYMDSEAARVNYGGSLSGTMTVFPDDDYRPLQTFSNQVRTDNKKGIIYPSARHSEDICVVLFDNHSSNIMDKPYEILKVHLKLIPECWNSDQNIEACYPYQNKLHPTMGYYCFPDEQKFEELRQKGYLYPDAMPRYGVLDFVRRCYHQNNTTAPVYAAHGMAYPGHAVIQASESPIEILPP